MRRFASLMGRRGVLAAAVVASVVLAIAALQRTLTTLVGVGAVIAQGYDGVGGIGGSLWLGTAIDTLTGALPFGIGVFLSLWLLAPIAAELRAAHVVARGLLAAAVGGALTVAVAVSAAMVGAARGLFPGLRFADVPVQLSSGFTTGLQHALLTVIDLLPLTVLVAILLWSWLTRHPNRHPVAGLLDQV